MKKIGILFLTVCVGCVFLSAQTPNESFQEFRKGLHRDYQDFRAHIKEQYADFLAGEWHPYEPLQSQEKYSKPKPKTAPVKEGSVKSPGADTEFRYKGKPDMGKSSPHQEENTTMKDPGEVDFYGVRLELPRIDFNILQNVTVAGQTSGQWKKLQEGSAEEYAQSLVRVGDELGLNGYLLFRLAQACVDNQFQTATPLARMSVVHFLLVQMGYDARLAVLESGAPLLLLPFEQKVYGSAYLNMDGRDYTVFGVEREGTPNLTGEQIYTCKIPQNVDAGRKINLKIDNLKMPYKAFPFEIKGNGLTLSGEMNENIFRMLYRYPQMPTEDFASSVLDSQLRESLVKSLRNQLVGKSKEECVNMLLGFFHSGFPYATDEERHGFEKPYFLEETLYYDKCDCEDRAIMFTWLLWNALGIESQLISYPMHESASVCIPEGVDGGYSYKYKGQTYWSADPTYIGSKVGDVMPQFNGVAPKIDKSYGED